jgi:23S rRNA pseudouridine1911/1915/1917 synthase
VAHEILTHTARIYEAGRSVQQLLASLGLSEREIRSAASAGLVRVNRRITRITARIRAGDLVEIAPAGASVGGTEAVEIPLRIVHEDDDLVVLDKPPYLLVHPSRPDQRHTLLAGLAHHYLRTGVTARLHPVHRLDRDTSGLVVVAKSPEVHTRLAQQLEARELRREYLAWVWGRVDDEAGRVDAPIGPDSAHPVLRSVRPDGDPASTRYRVVERFPTATLLRLVLETGRTHQIRVHLAYLGHPLLGDRQYGRRGLRLIARQALHAERLALRHPRSAESLTFHTPVPEDLRMLRERLAER